MVQLEIIVVEKIFPKADVLKKHEYLGKFAGIPADIESNAPLESKKLE